MLKVRLMGTKNDIKWFGKILQRNSKIEVTEFSDLYPNKGTKKFYRAYVEVKKTNVAESQQRVKENVYVYAVYDNTGNKVTSADETATAFTVYVTPEKVEQINMAVCYGGIQMYLKTE